MFFVHFPVPFNNSMLYMIDIPFFYLFCPSSLLSLFLSIYNAYYLYLAYAIFAEKYTVQFGGVEVLIYNTKC